MKTEEQQTNAPAIVEEAGDELGAPSQDESDDWTPDDLNEDQRQQYERGVAAVDQFLSDERTKQYEPTDANREKLLAYLEQHDLPLSFGGLYVAFEQLSEAGELESSDGQAADEEQPDACAATAGLARTKSEESEAPAPAPSSQPKKKPTAWRNGKEIEVGS